MWLGPQCYFIQRSTRTEGATKVVGDGSKNEVEFEHQLLVNP